MTLTDGLNRGRLALEEGRWEDALSAFDEVLDEREDAEALEGKGEALWWLGDSEQSVRHRERAFAALRAASEDVRACRVAIDLSISYLVNLGNLSASRGWLQRATRTVESVDPNPVEGWLWLMNGFLSSDEDSRSWFERALEFAQRHNDTDLELIALSDLGLSSVASGEVEKGLAALDEAMAATVAGEYGRLSTVVYTTCNMLAACSMAADLERATEWCRNADEFTRRYGSPFMYATCRAHFGGVLIDCGRWADAEKELLTALEMSQGASPAAHVEAMARLGDLRLRQGRLEEAEAFLENVDDSLPGMLPAASLWLTQGHADLAVAHLRRRLQLMPGPSIVKPAVLAMLVEAHLAAADIEAAEEALAQLDQVAKADGRANPLARATLARAHVAMAKGMATEGVKALEECLHRFSLLKLPLEVARVRLELAESLADSDPGVAAAEAQRAFADFESIGASADGDRAARLLRSLGVTPRSRRPRPESLTKREQEVLLLLGEGLANPDIADRLYISPKTAAHHVSNVLSKLGLRNRAEAAAYVARARSPDGRHPR